MCTTARMSQLNSSTQRTRSLVMRVSRMSSTANLHRTSNNLFFLLVRKKLGIKITADNKMYHRHVCNISSDHITEIHFDISVQWFVVYLEKDIWMNKAETFIQSRKETTTAAKVILYGCAMHFLLYSDHKIFLLAIASWNLTAHNYGSHPWITLRETKRTPQTTQGTNYEYVTAWHIHARAALADDPPFCVRSFFLRTVNPEFHTPFLIFPTHQLHTHHLARQSWCTQRNTLSLCCTFLDAKLDLVLCGMLSGKKTTPNDTNQPVKPW